MTDDKREFYNKKCVWARLSMSEKEYEEWWDKVSWPCSLDHPDGIFDSVKEYREYFYLE
jgi:hypothetical protein